MSEIEGVNIKQLRKIPDERGSIMHMMRNDDENFEKFRKILWNFGKSSKIYRNFAEF